MSEAHVVALSGGKDSTAMAFKLREMYPDRCFIWICTPTGDELPDMWEHWSMLREQLGGEFMPIIGGTLNGLIEKQQALPNFRQRWCTRLLKIEPYAAFLMELSRRHTTIYSYVGLRADEEEREGGDYLRVPGVQNVFPLRDLGWGLNDVLHYLDDIGVTIPRRTDCARCYHQRLGEWWNLWKEHHDIFEEAARQEEAIGHTFRSPGRDSWPVQLNELGLKFERGDIPSGADIQGDLFKNAPVCRVCRM